MLTNGSWPLKLYSRTTKIDKIVEAPQIYYCVRSDWWEIPIPVFTESWHAEGSFLEIMAS